MHKILINTFIASIILLGNSTKLYPQLDKIQNKAPNLHYVSTKSLGIDSTFLHTKMDSIIEFAIKAKAFPGCQILAAKDGAIFFHKTYGYHTYDSINIVKKSDLYDWASVTKITGTLPALMKFYDEGKLSLDKPFSVYWKQFKHSNKKHITLRQMLVHQARLQPWISYWRKAYRKNKKMKRSVLRTERSKRFNSQIADGMYVNKKYKRKIYKAIKKSSLLKNQEQRYSGLPFFIFPKLIEDMSGKNYEEYIKNTFYKPIGANTITYNPLRYFNKSQIIPTENDSYFRKQQMQGYVHDEGAAMMGGVSGNAGLFGTTLDLAKMMQMYQNGGVYGNVRFLSDSVVKLFTSYQYRFKDNSRGLGFDKPDCKNRNNDYMAIDASDKSFGHSGFTGTFCWADPETGILFVFMSNRVYPSRKHKKLFSLNIRSNTHQLIYDALKKSNKK